MTPSQAARMALEYGDMMVGIERRRVLEIIAALPLTACDCERWVTELGEHGPDCEFDRELVYRTKVLVAVSTPATPDKDVPLSGAAVAAAAPEQRQTDR